MLNNFDFYVISTTIEIRFVLLLLLLRNKINARSDLAVLVVLWGGPVGFGEVRRLRGVIQAK